MDIIAQEFKTPGNIGALARVMKNFDFHNLVLYKPQCNHLSKEALDRAKHAKDIVQNAKVVDILEYDVLIGTTAIIGTDYNVRRNSLSPEKLATMEFHGKVGLLFGREGDGLTTEELDTCDVIVTIPTSKKSPTMNVSHAATIFLYELFRHSPKEKVGDNIRFAGKKEKEQFMNILENKVQAMDFPTDQKRETQRLVWRKVIGKSNLTRREIMALFGFFKRIR